MFNKEITKYVNKNFKTIFIYLLIVIVMTMILFCFDNQNERNNNNIKKNNLIHNIIKNKQNVSKSKVWDDNKNNIENKINNQLHKLQTNKINDTKIIEGFTDTSDSIENVKKILSITLNKTNKSEGYIKSLLINTKKTDSYGSDILINTLFGKFEEFEWDENFNSFDDLITKISNLNTDNLNSGDVSAGKKIFYFNLIKKNKKRCFDFHFNLSDGILLQLDFITSYNPNNPDELSNNTININGEIIETNIPNIIKRVKNFKTCDNLINFDNSENPSTSIPDTTIPNTTIPNNKNPNIDNILYQNNLIEVNQSIKKIKFTNCELKVKGNNNNILELKMSNTYKLNINLINEIIDNFDLSSTDIKSKLKTIISSQGDIILTQSITLNLVFNNKISTIINNIGTDVSRFIQLINLENSQETSSNTYIKYILETNDINAFGDNGNGNGIIIETLLFPEDIRINYKSLLNYVQNKITDINNEYLNNKYVDLLIPVIETDNKLLKNELKLNNYLNKTRFDKLTDSTNNNMKWYNTH
tara:strand:+ start:747 stop:2336 length:1590 start_codon:yes stop_codon:yes gene_type:complete